MNANAPTLGPRDPAISGQTRIAGIIGHPVRHSRSPRMHNAAFATLGLDWVYVPFDVRPDRLPSAVRGLADLGVAGFNVTIPHKEAILPLLDDISASARAIGAVNTVVVQDGKLFGHNTDGAGFSRALHEAFRFPSERFNALVLGAGGAARAVCDQLVREGMALRIANRTPEKAEALVASLLRHHPGADIRALPFKPLEIRAAIQWGDLIVNTTAIGLHAGDPPLIDMNGLSPRHIVVDLIYNPLTTPFLEAAKAERARTQNGLGMLLHQGALAFTLWTGQEAPVAVMKQALESA